MKRILFISILLLFVSTIFSYSAVIGEIEKINGSDYFPAIHEVLQNAKKSIYMVMYYVNYRKDEHQSKVSILVNDLVEAHERGVDVKIILDQNVVFKGNRLLGRDYEESGRNWSIFNYFKSKGMNVHLDNLEITTHGKPLVIDKEIVIVGSANWTKHALNIGNEHSVLIKSEELAKGYIEDFEKIQIDHEASAREPEKHVVFNNDLMINILSDFVVHSNDYCWNVYMYLVGNYESGEEIDFDYTKVAEYLGISDKMPEVRYREMLGYHTLKKLQEKYDLLTYLPERGKNAKVILKPYNDTKKEYFEINEKFWAYQWCMTLSLSGRYCYFINLIEGGLEHKMWMLSKRSLVKKYKVGKETISNGMAELRHYNLLEIEYGNIDFGKGYGNRLPNRYRLKKLYKMEDFNKELKKLYDKYGEKKVEQARGYAKIVFCENNLVDIEDIVKMMDEYGMDKINYAFSKVSKKSEDNPKRSIAYVKGILQSMAKGELSN